MNSLAVMSALIGVVMVVVALGMLLPVLAIDSPLKLLLSFFGRNSTGNFIELAHKHIRAEWPHTKGVAFLLYGGLTLLAVSLLLFCIPELIQMFATEKQL